MDVYLCMLLATKLELKLVYVYCLFIVDNNETLKIEFLLFLNNNICENENWVYYAFMMCIILCFFFSICKQLAINETWSSQKTKKYLLRKVSEKQLQLLLNVRFSFDNVLKKQLSL